jgi:nucleoside-diphosphate-sugar epimerase
MTESTRKIFLTGASGCVGHYVLDELLKDARNEVYALVRYPEHFLKDHLSHPQVKFLAGGLLQLDRFKDVLFEMDYVIHLATPWGGDQLIPINVNATQQLWDLLNPQKIQKILYFSTASLLGPGNRVTEQAATQGTLYIRTKYQTYYLNQKHPLSDKIYTFFPTWIFGGDKTHPYSHAATGLTDLPRILKLLRYLKIDFKFHFIHAADIAQVVSYTLGNEMPHEIILGQKVLSLDEFVKSALKYFNIAKRPAIRISDSLIKIVAFFLGDRLSDWDHYCLKQKHFIFETTYPEKLGLKSIAKDVPELLKSFNL